MAGIHGPHPISSKLQLRLPVQIARQLNIEPGDNFYWRLSDDEPGAVILLPAEVVERRYSTGERIERVGRDLAAELHQSVED